jgi:hypothetical protein
MYRCHGERFVFSAVGTGLSNIIYMSFRFKDMMTQCYIKSPLMFNSTDLF